MKLKTMLLMFVILLSFSAYALTECMDEAKINTPCRITTPRISCSTYDIYNDTNQLITDDGDMTQIGSTGVYNFTFTQSKTGMYTILLCSNDTAFVNVFTNTIHTSLDIIIAGIQSNTTYSISGVWNYNITSYNTTSDFSSAGSYLKGLEEYYYG